MKFFRRPRNVKSMKQNTFIQVFALKDQNKMDTC